MIVALPGLFSYFFSEGNLFDFHCFKFMTSIVMSYGFPDRILTVIRFSDFIYLIILLY